MPTSSFRDKEVYKLRRVPPNLISAKTVLRRRRHCAWISRSRQGGRGSPLGSRPFKFVKVKNRTLDGAQRRQIVNEETLSFTGFCMAL